MRPRRSAGHVPRKRATEAIVDAKMRGAAATFYRNAQPLLDVPGSRVTSHLSIHCATSLCKCTLHVSACMVFLSGRAY